MNINGYGISYNYNSHGISANKAKTSSVFAVALDEKIKTESKKNSNTNQTNQVYDPFEDMTKTGSVSLPSWIYTKTELTRSEEEILRDIVEVAKRHAQQGTFQYEDEEFKSLVKEWTSPVSPDRENILKDTVKKINEEKNSTHKNNGEEKDFDMIDMLMQALKTGNKTGSSGNEKVTNADGSHILNMNGDTYIACVEDGKVTFANIRDDSGNTVMVFDNVNSLGQLSLEQSWTEEEGLRRAELLGVYNEAYKSIVGSYKSVNDPNGFVSGNTFKAAG